MYQNWINATGTGMCNIVDALRKSDNTIFNWGHSGSLFVVVWACVFERVELVSNPTTFMVTQKNVVICIFPSDILYHHCLYYVALFYKSLTLSGLFAFSFSTPTMENLFCWMLITIIIICKEVTYPLLHLVILLWTRI